MHVDYPFIPKGGISVGNERKHAIFPLACSILAHFDIPKKRTEICNSFRHAIIF